MSEPCYCEDYWRARVCSVECTYCVTAWLVVRHVLNIVFLPLFSHSPTRPPSYSTPLAPSPWQSSRHGRV
jgi:hypothetical protein